MKMLLSDMVVHSIDITLESRKVAFDCIDRDAHTILVAHIILSVVVYLIVLSTHCCTHQNSGTVRHEMRTFINHLFNNGLQVFSRNTFHMPRLNARATL